MRSNCSSRTGSATQLAKAITQRLTRAAGQCAGGGDLHPSQALLRQVPSAVLRERHATNRAGLVGARLPVFQHLLSVLFREAPSEHYPIQRSVLPTWAVIHSEFFPSLRTIQHRVAPSGAEKRSGSWGI